ncbi:hypothetical protein AGOR_G00102790 [Albula goreensis]|uniref:Arginine/serine-rich protein 1 n=1 Tax=Albula goreensis TaxID=1534307 RepID=A0A8T3DI62_9TELE|nr:hypothetical protein AGOR_G00102790 [Albula goreensis]
MAVESQSFQNNFGMVEKNEKMFSVASPDNTREETQMSEKTVDSFHTETSDNQNKEMDQPPVSDRECRSRSVSMTSSSRSRSRSSSSSSCSSGGSYSSGSSRRGAVVATPAGGTTCDHTLAAVVPGPALAPARGHVPAATGCAPASHAVGDTIAAAPRPAATERGRGPTAPRPSGPPTAVAGPVPLPTTDLAGARCLAPGPAPEAAGCTDLWAGAGSGLTAPSTGGAEPGARSRSRSRSTSPNRNNIHLTQEEKRALLLIARTNAANALGVEDVALPASVSPAVAVHEEPTIEERVRPCGTALSSLKENHKPSEADEIPSPKMSPRNRITFSIRNTVAKPASSRPSSSPEKTVTVRTDSVTAQNPYGRWVPINARSFPLSIAKSSSTKTR